MYVQATDLVPGHWEEIHVVGLDSWTFQWNILIAVCINVLMILGSIMHQQQLRQLQSSKQRHFWIDKMFNWILLKWYLLNQIKINSRWWTVPPGTCFTPHLAHGFIEQMGSFLHFRWNWISFQEGWCIVKRYGENMPSSGVREYCIFTLFLL